MIHALLACDWLPTLSELCDGKLPAAGELDGRSLAKAIDSSDDPRRAGLAPAEPVGRPPGPWKLIHNAHDTTTPETAKTSIARILANVEDDPPEKVNRSKDDPEIATRLRKLYDDGLTAHQRKPAAPRAAKRRHFDSPTRERRAL